MSCSPRMMRNPSSAAVASCEGRTHSFQPGETPEMTRTETKEQQIERLIERHVRDRNMDPRSIEETYRVHACRHRDRSRFLRRSAGYGLGLLQGRAAPSRSHHAQHDHLRLSRVSAVDGMFPSGPQGRHDGRNLRADDRGARSGPCRRRRPDASSRLRGHPEDEDRGPCAGVPAGALDQPLGQVRLPARRRHRSRRSNCR